MSIEDILATIAGIIDKLVPFIIGLAVFVMLWGIFKYLSGVGDEEKRQEARLFVIWGIIGVFVMISIWGLINILRNTFTLTDDSPDAAMPELPAIPGVTNPGP